MKYYTKLTILYIRREWLMLQLITVCIADNILDAILNLIFRRR